MKNLFINFVDKRQLQNKKRLSKLNELEIMRFIILNHSRYTF